VNKEAAGPAPFIPTHTPYQRKGGEEGKREKENGKKREGKEKEKRR